MSSDKKPIVYPDFLAERYTLLRELGQGAYGIVRYTMWNMGGWLEIQRMAAEPWHYHCLLGRSVLR